MDDQDTKKALRCPGGPKKRTRTRNPGSGCPCATEPVHKAENQPFRLVFCFVGYTSKLSNFFEDLQKLDAFSQSIEYLLADDDKEKKNH